MIFFLADKIFAAHLSPVFALERYVSGKRHQALRQRLVIPASCRAARKALTGRYSKSEVDRALADIDLNPWSIPELELARILRAAGITGHRPNHEVWVGEENYH